MLPLLVVLPVIAYAYVVQVVVIAKAEQHERDNRLKDLESLEYRIRELQGWTAETCRDYAHWDDLYHQVSSPSDEWITANIEYGLGYSFGFDVVVLQDGKGAVLWEKNLNRSVLSELRRRGVLRRCLNKSETVGVMVLNGRVHICAAMPILMSGGKGRPRGMAFVGLKMDESLLRRLEAGTGRRLALTQTDAIVTAFDGLGKARNLPPKVADVLSRSYVPVQAELVVSRDGATSYGLLPINNLDGCPIGTIIDVSSRENLAANMTAIRRMSYGLMLLCAVAGVVGTSYARTLALAKRASRDHLTGLHNHGYMQDYLKTEVQRAHRYGRPLSVAMLDIDHFKVVNDTYGHGVGDQVLQQLSGILLATVRETDLVSRYGGEEFLIVMPETDLLQAVAGAERIRAAVQAHRFAPSAAKWSGGSPEFTVTVSIGVAAFPEDAAEPSTLVAAADLGLASAKVTRNAVVSYRDATEPNSDEGAPLKILEGFLRDCRLSVIRPLVAAINLKVPGSETHSEKVAGYTVQICKELGWSTQEIAQACRAALLMDVGKIAVPDEILAKNSGLSQAEMELVRQHPRFGADIISRSPQMAQVSEFVLHHHERFDGQGYPDGLAGEDIPLVSRLLAVADAAVAMTSDRAYRKARSTEEAIAELRLQSGKQFDPNIVDAAVRAIERMAEPLDSRRSAA